MAVQAFQGILPQILVLAKAQAAASSLRTVLETVHRGKRFRRRAGLLSPQFCDGEIEVEDVSIGCFVHVQFLIHSLGILFVSGSSGSSSALPFEIVVPSGRNDIRCGQVRFREVDRGKPACQILPANDWSDFH